MKMQSYPSVLQLLLVLSSLLQASHAEGPGETERRDTVDCLERDLKELQDTVANLKTQLEEQKTVPVAFGASLGIIGTVGPYNTEVTLVYKKVFANVGNAYNPGSGIFTAPVEGVYYFSFSGHHSSRRAMGLKLIKNGELITIAYNHAAGNRPETVTHGMTLELKKGDQVYVRLYANTWLFDNANIHGTFIGHLLFAL